MYQSQIQIDSLQKQQNSEKKTLSSLKEEAEGEDYQQNQRKNSEISEKYQLMNNHNAKNEGRALGKKKSI